MHIKICGITCYNDARAAVEYGADMLGFVLYPQSKRAISMDDAARIAQQLPAHVRKVAVLVNEPLTVVQQLIERHVFDVVQLHGDETPSYCNKISGIKIFKAFRISNEKDLDVLKKYRVDGYLLDAYQPDMFGGTGSTFDWELARTATQLVSPIILSGGLSPDNVAYAIACVHPWAVDVSSGVEKEPGKKDHAKVRQFILNAR